MTRGSSRTRQKKCQDGIVHVVCEITKVPPDLSRTRVIPAKRKQRDEQSAESSRLNLDKRGANPTGPSDSCLASGTGSDGPDTDMDDEEQSFEDSTQEDPPVQDWETVEASIMKNSADESQFSDDDDDMNQPKAFLEEDQTLRMWWYDMYERYEKGHVYIFGKIYDKNKAAFVSCTVIVKNVPRNVFVLPRQFWLDDEGNPTQNRVVIPEDVTSELGEIFTHQHIHTWNYKRVTRRYAFELADIPAEAEYLKITYDYDQPQLLEDLAGRTFSRVFGVNTSSLEQFLIKRDIMGPGWLEITDAKQSKAGDSWSKIEIVVESPKCVRPLGETQDPLYSQAPPLTVMAIKVQTMMNHQKTANEVIAASAFVCTKVRIDEPSPIEDQCKTRFSVIRPLSHDIPLPAGLAKLLQHERDSGFLCHAERTELALLSYLTAKIHRYDPDVVVGHNFQGCDLDILLHRMKHFKTPHWHKLGRLRFKTWPKLQQGPGGTDEPTFQERMVLCGRLLCDTYIASKDLIRAKSYHLTHLAREQLGIHRHEVIADQIRQSYESPDSLIRLAKHGSFDAYLSMALMFKLQILPLTKQMTNLAGNLWSRSMNGARANRNEFLLLHEFHRQKFICPDKLTRSKEVEVVDFGQETTDDSEPKLAKDLLVQPTKTKTYSGGLVLEPKSGLYNKYVLLLDFNSLYPSIIQEYNVCFTTVKRDHLAARGSESSEESKDGDNLPKAPDPSIPQGVLPRLVKAFVDRRKKVKTAMKNPSLNAVARMQLDIQQMALKLTANSMYGCLGFSSSRFCAKPLAMLITSKGREILQETVDLARESLGLDVIYGDTDSIMVHTGKDELARAKVIGEQLKELVNQRYGILEIDIDGYFKHFLLLKKKKYAALLVKEWNGKLVEKIETKGLDLVRRDWCGLSHDVSMRVLKTILSGHDEKRIVKKVHRLMRKSRELVWQDGLNLDKFFVINKQLTKNPGDYTDSRSHPHVQVAKRMRQAGAVVKAGDTIPFVICLSESLQEEDVQQGTAQKAFHPDDVKRGIARLDREWYLANQVLPPIIRLCSPLIDTDAVQLAQCLGLDTSKKTRKRRTHLLSDPQPIPACVQRLNKAERVMICCSRCFKRNNLKTLLTQLTGEIQCLYCDSIQSIPSLQSQLTLVIRKHISRYYEGWLVCSTKVCEGRVRGMRQTGQCPEAGCAGELMQEYTSEHLYTQLAYLWRLFEEVDAADALHPEQFQVLRSTVDKYLQRCGYRYINLQTFNWE